MSAIFSHYCSLFATVSCFRFCSHAGLLHCLVTSHTGIRLSDDVCQTCRIKLFFPYWHLDYHPDDGDVGDGTVQAALVPESSGSERFSASEESPPIPGSFELVSSTPSKLETTVVNTKTETKLEVKPDPQATQPTIPTPALQQSGGATKQPEGDADPKGNKPTFKPKPKPP